MMEIQMKRTRNFWGDIGKVPNLLCIYRIVSLPIIVILFYSGHYGLTLFLAILAPLSDLFDGIIARRFNMVTELGALLDIVSDLLFTCIVLLLAVHEGVWPLYLFIVWSFRDISVLAMRWSAAQLGFSVPSIVLGKISTDFIYVALTVFFLDVLQPFQSSPEFNGYIHILGLALIHIGLLLQWITALVYFCRYYHLYQTT
jgi:CDP-diacylglycerol--glycerol-3-phosphate 3-phosphatidyltransferase